MKPQCLGLATLAALAGSIVLSSAADAQPAPDWRRSPSFGATALQSGFVPDPAAYGLTAGGGSDPIQVASLGLVDAATGQACSQSYVARSPDFRFQFAAGQSFSFLRFFVVTQNAADATLLINQPDGSWRCNDDSFGTLMPSIDFQAPMSGQYDIWVGTYQASSGNPSVLYVTELQSVNPTTANLPAAGNVARASAGVDWGSTASYGSERLAAPLAQQPTSFRLTAGGGSNPINVSEANLVDAHSGEACTQAFVARSPDYRFTLSERTPFEFLRFFVRTDNGADATLLMRLPNDTWRCNDDAFNTLMPAIDFREPPAGRYDVWVGTYTASENNPAQLFITEDKNLTP